MVFAAFDAFDVIQAVLSIWILEGNGHSKASASWFLAAPCPYNLRRCKYHSARLYRPGRRYARNRVIRVFRFVAYDARRLYARVVDRFSTCSPSRGLGNAVLPAGRFCRIPFVVWDGLSRWLMFLVQAYDCIASGLYILSN